MRRVLARSAHGTHVAPLSEMPRRHALRRLGVAGGALAVGIVAACSAGPPESEKAASSAVSHRAFDRNDVLDDKSMRDSRAMTVGDVQKFLEKTPWGTRSGLASFKENGKSAAQIMVEAAIAQGINPIEMLVRVQMEEGLVSETTAPAATVKIAFGCGCPSSPVCSEKYMGFANQADCAAGTLRRSMDKAVTTQGTVSGWARSKAKETVDGVTIVPANAVTAALYTYTPYVGEAGGGQPGVGGVSLHAQVWDRFAEFLSYGAWAAPATPDAPDETEAGSAPDASTPVKIPAPKPDAAPDPPPRPTSDPAKDAGSTPDSGSGATGAPKDGSEDGDLLKGGNTPPASNAPPPSTKKTTPSKPTEHPMATEEDLAGKPKDAGCSTSRASSNGSTGWLAASAIAISILASRRRRAG